ncbi:hypothetical protein EDD22DRAFT_974223 [Suillus occidentalis]|nr:hypothetical protein EDD22DRAFT_974223 [Suillus occidentalis]
MKPNAEFLSLPEEIQCNILSFLSCRDILCCTSVCKALRQTYISSSELQYIVELSGQRLLHVPNTDDVNIPVSERLQLLRDKAHAWFKIDAHSFKTVLLSENMYSDEAFVADGHIYSWDRAEDTAKIVPILPQPSQKPVNRDWSPGTLFHPNSRSIDVFMDPAQNLIATSNHETFYIDLKTLDSDNVHPKAAGPELILSLLPISEDYLLEIEEAQLKGFGRYIALRCSFVSYEEIWQLHIWDWQHSMTSNSVLMGTCFTPNPIDFCFLGNDRLLVVAEELKLYSIEDMSQTPQLLARFSMPVPFLDAQCFLPIDHTEHSSPQTQAQQTMYSSDPQNRLLCILAEATHVYIISTRIFFNLDGRAAAIPVPWECWGPSNTRIFAHWDAYRVHVFGNRVLRATPIGTSASSLLTKFALHMMDFSPLAVTNRRDLGRVVKEPSTIVMHLDDLIDRPAESVTTSLSYVEVMLNNKWFGSNDSELVDLWVDKDRIYLLKRKRDHEAVGSVHDYGIGNSELEVIHV